MNQLVIKNIIKSAIDLHVHIGPEVIPRKYTARSLVAAEQGQIAGMALKNHFFPTLPLIKATQYASNIKLIGGLVLNNAVGGLNPEAIYATSTLAQGQPFIVWFPTTNAAQFLCNCEYEIAPEWVNSPTFMARPANIISPIKVTDAKGSLTLKAKKVCQAIKSSNAIIATGHISWQEAVEVVRYANKIGIRKIIITHPIYQKIAMPTAIQKQLVANGAFIEHCFSMYSIDNIPVQKITNQIKTVGAKNCILSSDVGQSFSAPPSEALLEFATLLQKSGISINELITMLVDNPTKLISKVLK